MSLLMTTILLALISPTHEWPITTKATCDSLLSCNDHGACTNSEEYGTVCLCDAEWIGVRCQIPREKYLNGTVDEPCEHMIDCNDHGVCSGNVENLQCNCYEGWFGVRCQIPIIDHGVCSGNVENLQCNCFEGWFGVRCQIPEEKMIHV